MISSSLVITSGESPDGEFLYIHSEMKKRPFKVSVYNVFFAKEFDEILSKFSFVTDNIISEMTPMESKYHIHEKHLLRYTGKNIWISFIKSGAQSDSPFINDVFIYFKNIEDKKFVNTLIEDLSGCSLQYDGEDESPRVSTICINNSSLDLEPLDSVSDIDCFYSAKNTKDIKKIIKEINKSDKGISIIRGGRGMGKTNAAKYIASKLDRVSIFIPNNMIDHTINNPEFRNYLKRFERVMIIVDDCEFVYSLPTKFNYVTNNILQLVDGFLSDTMSLHFLLIFNECREIDPMLLDSNSFVSIIDFEELSEKESKKLAKKMNIEMDIEGTHKIIDILNGNKRQIRKVGIH